LRRAAAFWSHLVFADPASLVHRAFRDDLSLHGAGGDCWVARMLPQLLRFQALPSPVPAPAWSASACLPEVQLLQHNAAYWAAVSCLHPRPRDVPASHPHGRTLYTFAAWFRGLTAGLPVHHNIPDVAWRVVLRFCTGGWFLRGASAHWRLGPAAPGCPCCGRPPEDALHIVLECPAYSDLRALHGPLFVGLSSDPDVAMQMVFCPSHFRPLSRFLLACLARRGEFLAGRPALVLEDEGLPSLLFGSVAALSPWVCLVLAGASVVVVCLVVLVVSLCFGA
jgi:hypothetical protein